MAPGAAPGAGGPPLNGPRVFSGHLLKPTPNNENSGGVNYLGGPFLFGGRDYSLKNFW